MGAEQSRGEEDGGSAAEGATLSGIDDVFDSSLDQLKSMGLIYFPEPDEEAEDEEEQCDSTDMYQVVEGLWLGGSADAANPELLRRKGIRRVLNLAGGEAAGAPIPGVKTMIVGALDEDGYDVIRHAPECARFIEEGLRGGEVVLVHSLRGRSRAPVITAAYLVSRHATSARDALELISAKRPRALGRAQPPRGSFIKQLEKLSRGLAVTGAYRSTGGATPRTLEKRCADALGQEGNASHGPLDGGDADEGEAAEVVERSWTREAYFAGRLYPEAGTEGKMPQGRGKGKEGHGGARRLSTISHFAPACVGDQAANTDLAVIGDQAVKSDQTVYSDQRAASGGTPAAFEPEVRLKQLFASGASMHLHAKDSGQLLNLTA